jgi:hypothetical protein
MSRIQEPLHLLDLPVHQIIGSQQGTTDWQAPYITPVTTGEAQNNPTIHCSGSKRGPANRVAANTCRTTCGIEQQNGGDTTRSVCEDTPNQRHVRQASATDASLKASSPNQKAEFVNCITNQPGHRCIQVRHSREAPPRKRSFDATLPNIRCLGRVGFAGFQPLGFDSHV